mmetsp:Transcript_56864/g.120729  ORF Transcript_56864/g.120729 Transcript_56864/m.120729 type:complete len:81 (+) Transcript_56864:49-291(+)
MQMHSPIAYQKFIESKSKYEEKNQSLRAQCLNKMDVVVRNEDSPCSLMAHLPVRAAVPSQQLLLVVRGVILIVPQRSHFT